MIRIVKPNPGPAILSKSDGKGRTATRTMNDAYDSGTRAFAFDNKIYGATSVKNALIKAQHKKCCFCEASVRAVSYGDVEHFRPKGGWQQKPGDPLTQPGYYWLAYDWSNLLLSCQLCNQRHKKNLFPLDNPAHRARSHDDDIQLEVPKFVNPSAEEPSDYIGFRKEYAITIDGNDYGTTTIESLGLNRTDLVELRREVLAPIVALEQSTQVLIEEANSDDSPSAALTNLIAKNQQVLADARKPTAQFSSMVKHAIGDS